MSCDSCNDSSIDLNDCTECTDGQDGGYCLHWLFDGSTSVGPSSTYLRFNNSTISSVTTLYISDTAVGSIAAQAYLDTFDDTGTSSNYGYITMIKDDDSTILAMFKITAVVDSGTYHTITVTYITGAGSFSQANNLLLCFTPTGVQGATGSSGPSLPLTADMVSTVADLNIGAVTGSDVAHPLMTWTLGAGTYIFNYKAEMTSDVATYSGYYGIYLNTVLRAATKRFFGTTIAALDGEYRHIGVDEKITLSGATTVAIYFRAAVGANTHVIAGSFGYLQIA